LQAQQVPPVALAAARSMLSNIERNFPAFVRQVHPKLGLTYYESAWTLTPEKPLTQGFLLRSWNSKKGDIKMESDNDASASYVTNASKFLRTVVKKKPFRSSGDIRYNIKSLQFSTDLFRKAAPGEELVSFHTTDPSSELGWSCLILRLRKTGTRYYVSGIDYLYWTP
jgi:hypothetical protein